VRSAQRAGATSPGPPAPTPDARFAQACARSGGGDGGGGSGVSPAEAARLADGALSEMEAAGIARDPHSVSISVTVFGRAGRLERAAEARPRSSRDLAEI